MSFLDAISKVYRKVVRAVEDVRDIANPSNWERKIEENKKAFADIFGTNWSICSEAEKEEAVTRIKHHTIHDLIPLAGQLGIWGVPGIFSYTPCQIASAVAIARVYDPNYTSTWNYTRSIVGVMFWGNFTELTWTQVVAVVKNLLPLPLINIAIIPYVQTSTEIALNKVHGYFFDKYSTSNIKNSVSVNSKDNQVNTSRQNVDNKNAEVLQQKKFTQHKVANSQLNTENSTCSNRTSVQTATPITELNARNSELLETSHKLLQRLSKGGKVLFSAQEEVFRELIQKSKNKSVLELGRTHIFRGVAGSGKTVILGQIIPHLITSFKQSYGREPSILVYHFNKYIHKLLKEEIFLATKAPIDLEPISESCYRRTVQVHTLSSLIKEELIKKNLLRNGNISQGFMPNREKAKQTLGLLKPHEGLFDIVVIDEGQDIEGHELALVATLCRNIPKLTSLNKSIYIFYDDLQNIFGNHGLLLERLQSIPDLQNQEIIQHFLSRCIRSSKKILDFTINTCLGLDLDIASKEKLEVAMNIQQLHKKNLISFSKAPDGKEWIDCHFCIFPGEVSPQVALFQSNRSLYQAIRQELRKLINEWQQLNRILRENDLTEHKRSILIQCFSHKVAEELFNELAAEFNSTDRERNKQIVQLRSGDSITDKQKHLAVETSRINIATVWDAKGYDADTVYVVNPDGCQGTAYEKRVQFYVAATRAKQFLAVYSSIPENNALIISDAMRVINQINGINSQAHQEAF